MQLVIVESPNKVKKIRSLLGSGYDVVATCGHFRDLPRRELGVDADTMDVEYAPIEGKGEIIARLRGKATNADGVILATDPDREGEAIAWHVAQILGAKGRAAKRARFQEITGLAVRDAIAAASTIDQDLVDAQQARRVFDRLCGYRVSPLLRPFGRGLSAGRVQSAALHLVVKREKQRRDFKKQTFYEVVAHYEEGFDAHAVDCGADGKLERLRLESEQEAQSLADHLRAASHVVSSVDVRRASRKPRPPFTTSSLQQVASSVLKLSPDATMKLAQGLFEGGLITYHRTDSVHLSDEAIQLAREHIASHAPEALPDKPPTYKSKASSQEAHEAIRPTSLALESDDLNEQAQSLWALIRDRFLASQSKPAMLRKTRVLIDANGFCLVAVASQVVEPGYRRFLDFDETGDAGKQEEESAELSVQHNQALCVGKCEPKKTATKPMPAFTEATLVREMERVGIGRPSTYAATVKLLLERSYVALEKRNLHSTELGELVEGLLGKGFPELLEPGFTAEMEGQLDQVAKGDLAWKPVCKTYNNGLDTQIEKAKPIFDELAAKTPNARKPPQHTGKPCPNCGKELLLRQGGNGAFLACSAYPKCRYTLDASEDPIAPQATMACPACENGKMLKRNGPHGAFWRCSSCTKALDAKALRAAKGAKCPECDAPMLSRQGRSGPFLGCSRYPDCKCTTSASGKVHKRKAKQQTAEQSIFLQQSIATRTHRYAGDT